MLDFLERVGTDFQFGKRRPVHERQHPRSQRQVNSVPLLDQGHAMAPVHAVLPQRLPQGRWWEAFRTSYQPDLRKLSFSHTPVPACLINVLTSNRTLRTRSHSWSATSSFMVGGDRSVSFMARRNRRRASQVSRSRIFDSCDMCCRVRKTRWQSTACLFIVSCPMQKDRSLFCKSAQHNSVHAQLTIWIIKHVIPLT